MSAEVHIVLASRRDVVTIPAAAIKTDSKGGHSVETVTSDGKVSTSEIEVGLGDNVNVEVVSGLTEGSTVVIGQASSGEKASSSAGGPPPPMGL